MTCFYLISSKKFSYASNIFKWSVIYFPLFSLKYLIQQTCKSASYGAGSAKKVPDFSFVPLDSGMFVAFSLGSNKGSTVPQF